MVRDKKSGCHFLFFLGVWWGGEEPGAPQTHRNSFHIQLLKTPEDGPHSRVEKRSSNLPAAEKRSVTPNRQHWQHNHRSHVIYRNLPGHLQGCLPWLPWKCALKASPRTQPTCGYQLQGHTSPRLPLPAQQGIPLKDTFAQDSPHPG